MRSFKIILTSIVLLFILQNKLLAEIRYVDFKYVLNESKAGKEAQNYLKKKLDNGIKDLKAKEKSIQEEEKKIIQQKKLISAEEYKKQVKALRQKVSSLQTQRNNLLDTVAKQRSKARSELLKTLNPIIKDYMKKNTVRLVLEKKSILLADENLNITKEITDLLNKKLKSIKLN
ncbi:MAG: OmpH family outer membrane protein [Candidatus Pelagibacter sp. TMED263]|nr:MAG: OmpH family outer membrane protein [Candidatus Pelagibacter sp. TMED263]|tara:strand:- start:1179 stop:1700 length:522 start_codon:yes stop_codon:yes gene_type:complete